MAPLIDDCTRPGGGVEEEKIPPLCSTLVLQRPAKLQPLILSLAGAEVLGQNRGSLLNIRNHPPNPFPGANPTQPPSWVRVPQKRPSTEIRIPPKWDIILPQATSTTKRRTNLPENSLFEIIIGIILTFFLSARNSFAMHQYCIWQLKTSLFNQLIYVLSQCFSLKFNISTQSAA